MKKKILQFPIANSKGGITQYILNNWKWMDKEKIQCDFVTMSSYLEFENEILETGSKVYHISCYAEDNREQFINEFEKILSRGYDVVHLHTKQWKSFLVEELCIKLGIPKVIVHSHSSGIEVNDPIKRKEEKILHEQVKEMFCENMATDFWACSKTAANHLFGKQISSKRIKIMPNAIDLKKFGYDEEIRNKIRKKYGLEGCFVLGHVGRYEYSKNHEFLINVFSQISKRTEDARLILIGDGNLFQKVQERAEKLGLTKKILFLGKRSDVSEWYQAMDVFCLPSRFEGLPIVMIEAQASGMPCIGSDCISEEIKIGSNVNLLPLKEEVWVNCLLKLKKERRENNIKKLAESGYDIKKQIKILEKMYMS